MQKKFGLSLVVFLAFTGILLIAGCSRRQGIVIESEWDITQMFGKTGNSQVRYMYDVDGDGEKELVCNIGSQAHFAAIKVDGTILWETVVDEVQHKSAYYPKVHDGVLYYGDRNNSTIYAINLDDGSMEWATVRTDLVAINICDRGVVYGAKGKVGILDFNTGHELPGWPYPFTPHEQILASGDLDGDGYDEIFCNDNKGNIIAIDHDGNLMFTISSNHSHVDMMFVADIDLNHPGNELLTILDDDNSTGGTEGDEIALYDAKGDRIAKFTAPYGGITLRVGDVRRDYEGLEVAYCCEGSGVLGLLTGSLDEIWRVTGIPGTGQTGQIQLADINGDGEVKILTNTGETPSDGFIVFDNQGKRLCTVTGYGWDFDPRIDKKTGEPFLAADLDQDGKAEIMPGLLGADDKHGKEVIRVLGWGRKR